MVYFCCINVCIPCWYFFWWGASDMELWRTGYSNQCVSVFVTTWGSKGEFFHEERVFPWSPWRPWGIRAEYQPSNQPPKKLLCQESGPVVFAKNKCMWSWTVLLDSDHWALKFPTDKHHAQKDRNGGAGGPGECVFCERMGTFGTTSPTTLTFISTCRMPLGCDGGWESRCCPGYREPLGPCLGVRLYGE